jgi:membrane-bound ClpP family serine protease
MWVVAGVLLGVVVLASLIGFHSGPHAHVAAGVAGALAAVWLVLMAVIGQRSAALWAVLAADLVVSAGIGVMAWKGLASRHVPVALHHGVRSIEGADAVAVSQLAPDGIVRARGEQWSAVALDGPIDAGQRVHVVGGDGVRLEVMGGAAGPPAGAELFSLEDGSSEGEAS